ncbi:MAG: peptidoglycan binding domain-containing protein [Nocardioides sp.]
MGRNERERAGARVVLVMLVVLVVLVGGGYVAAYAGSQHKTPRGTLVAGVNVGGRTLAAAVAALRSGLDTRVNSPITLDIGGKKTRILPAEVGLGIDYVASVQQAGAGDSWEPERLWDYYTGGSELAPVVTVSEMTMADYLTGLAVDSGVAPRDGGVRFESQRVEVIDPRPGRTIDPKQAQEAITAAFLSTDRTARIDLVPSAPAIDDADVREAVQKWANPAMSGPVALDLTQQQVRLQPRDYAAALSMRAVDGTLQPHVDARTLTRLVHERLLGNGKPSDAAVILTAGRPHITPARPGVRFEPAALVAAFTAALALPEGQRVAPVEVELTDPDFTTEDAQALKIEHRVAITTTTYPSGQAGPEVSRAVDLLDGTLLNPGETFSWSDVAGSGYGPDALPVATTLFDAAYDAGFGDVEHHAPATYAGRSLVGQEATVADGADLRFSVDSPSGVIIQAKLTGASPGIPGTVTIVLWSTTAWDVTVSTSARYDVVEPASTEDAGDGCVASPGKHGFSVDVTRHLHDVTGAAADRDETMTTTYAPIDAVVCTGTPAG